MEPPRAQSELTVDGQLTEAVWQNAAMLTGFSQFFPNDGVAAQDSTEILVWYSATALHIGVRAHAAPGTVRATLRMPRQPNGFAPALMLWVWSAFIFLFFSASHSKLISYLLPIALAMALTWSLNRAVTFGPSGRGLVAEGTRYGGVSLLASGVNYLAYSAVLLARPGTWPVLAVAIGSGVAMIVSFLGYSRFVFNR